MSIEQDKAAFERALRAHDALVERQALPIWVGAEPTFTDRFSEHPEWLREALGPTKASRARQMLTALKQTAADGVVLRTLGRQYPGEELPRWSLGLYGRRDGQPLWSGPPDPLLSAGRLVIPKLDAFWQGLAERLGEQGWTVATFELAVAPKRRIAFRLDGQAPPADPAQDARLARPSVHSHAIPLEGLRDELAEDGILLLGIDSTKVAEDATDGRAPCLELPALPTVAAFLTLLDCAGGAALAAGLGNLLLCGFPPPVDATVKWTTITPDPAVVEVNMAPATDVTTFWHGCRRLFAVADKMGLSPYRLHYNGQLTDSGGGGQITLGGPSPERSPFFVQPHLLPNLIRFFNRHPALSFYYACDFVGGSSQSPRPDERPGEFFQELQLALALLERQPAPAPEALWRALAPFMTDLVGNSHRSEINIEKLWNPYLPGRGCLGLVEFRAFRMAPTPELVAALAALLRAIVLLCAGPRDFALVRWDDVLHDRFALPFYLRQDLAAVLAELAEAGFGLEPPLVAELMDDSYYTLGSMNCGPCEFTLRRALEFWPLVGDAASQNSGGSRLVDASTARLEVTLRPHSETAADLDGWSLLAEGRQVPWRLEQDQTGPALVFGLRYRRFKPWHGLHLELEAHGPIDMVLLDPSGRDGWRIGWHEWKPQGGGYDGLPPDLAAARRRREERFVATALTEPPAIATPPAAALTPYCLDLRWLPVESR